jgi:hypothetical protein
MQQRVRDASQDDGGRDRAGEPAKPRHEDAHVVCALQRSGHVEADGVLAEYPSE